MVKSQQVRIRSSQHINIGFPPPYLYSPDTTFIMYDKIFGFKKFVSIVKLFQRSFSQKSKYRCQQNISVSNINNKNDLLKDEIRYYVDKKNPHEYKLYGVVADAASLTFLQRKSNKQLGEPFSSNSSLWHFPYYNSNDEMLLRDTCDVKLAIKSIGDYSSNVYRKGYEALQQYVNGEVLDQEVIPAFTALERFYNNKEIHERSLQKLKNVKLSGSEVTIVMTNHLLSQLIYHPTNYLIDENSLEKPAGECPCECGSQIHYGNTNIGSHQLFYGPTDIIIFSSAKNTIWNNSENSSLFKIMGGEKEWRLEKDIEDDKEQSQDELDTLELNIETEFTENQVNQICKQAIAVSLWKHKKRLNSVNDASGHSMIPVCLLNKTRYMMTLYNAEYDYLLRMENKGLPIFQNEDFNELNFSAVIDLWMMIHHFIFSSVPSEEDIQKFEGTFHLATKLDEKFTEIVKSSKFDYVLDVDNTSRKPKDASWNRSSCPVPTCTTEVWKVKKLHPFPENWMKIPAKFKDQIKNEFQITDEMHACCSVCLDRIMRRINQQKTT
ncbi:uncharacterized protein LOC134707987 [Mytilus trossulus]|uniref:uncharacterized protein LOC134707987 n=1 Tax=Mytilus trossulus TaxID=6551 RepID=UPI003005B1AA